MTATPGEIAAKQKELEQCKKKFEKTPLKPVRFAQIVIDTASGSSTWFTRRWRTSYKKDQFDTDPDLFGFFCTHDAWAIALVVTATAGVSQTLRNIGAGLAAIPVAGPFFAEDYFDLAAQLDIAALSFTTLGGFAAKVVDLLREFEGLGNDLMQDLIREIADAILSGQLSPSRCGPSGKIMDTHNYKLDKCFSVNSAELLRCADRGLYRVHRCDPQSGAGSRAAARHDRPSLRRAHHGQARHGALRADGVH